PVAARVDYCDGPAIAATPFYVMAHVEGRVIWEPHMPSAGPAERAAVYDAMNATLARLHAFDPAALGLSDFGRGDNYVARQVERWSKQYRASETEKIGDGAADRVAACASAAPRAGAHRSRRLPPRQHHSRAVAAYGPRGDRLGVVHLGRSARRPRLPSHAVAHAAVGDRGRRGHTRRPRPRPARHSHARGLCGRLRRAHR